MRSSGNTFKATPIIGLVLILFAIFTAHGQTKCLEPGKLEQLKKQIMSTEKPAENEALRVAIISAASELSGKQRHAAPPKIDGNSPPRRGPTFDEPTTTFVCSTLNTQGWPKSAAVGRDAIASFFFLIARGLSIQMQFELNPLVSQAYAAGEIEKGELLAVYLDKLRVSVGRKQLFGTQVFIRDDFLVMAPIEQPSRVEERRAQYQMMPLRSYERFLERSYQKVLIHSVMEPLSPDTKSSSGTAEETSPLVDDTDEKDVVKVKTSFVSMDVIVPDGAATATGLDKKDFRVFENDKPVEIETFAKAEAPFDIVLLLDMSDSTAGKAALIRKTTRRFVEMKRAVDRVAVVSFDQTQTLISGLESNNEVLLSRLKGIKSGGGSNVWDAVKFGLDLLDKHGEKGRRKAVVLMSDGEENALMYLSGVGSKISFAELVDVVRRGSTAIFPIYLETEKKGRGSDWIGAQAQRTLNYLAEQSAGNLYQAKEIDDLNTVYGRVLTDVGTVYSLGFEPEEDTSTNDNWRTLRVEVPSLPGLKLKYRPGYFVR